MSTFSDSLKSTRPGRPHVFLSNAIHADNNFSCRKWPGLVEIASQRAPPPNRPKTPYVVVPQSVKPNFGQSRMGTKSTEKMGSRFPGLEVWVGFGATASIQAWPFCWNADCRKSPGLRQAFGRCGQATSIDDYGAPGHLCVLHFKRLKSSSALERLPRPL